ncbi:hypothetical protein niasHS_016971 [Heterodera schachtii]|uniref:Glycoside hydrolase family 5 domain-containing protein n=1 Tax=Heterodera schachtii TaxID=97005 RepID=A0ABD2HYT8_HETSC
MVPVLLAAVALHGNSLFWSQWYPQFWNATTLKALKCTWNANVVRAAMGVDQGGYLSTESSQYQLVTTRDVHRPSGCFLYKNCQSIWQLPTHNLHAGTHTVSGLGAKLKTAYTNSLPIFVTEYGACESSGNGTIATSSMNEWWSFLDGYKISYCNWSVCNKGESCSALTTSASASNVGSSSYWTTSGKLIQAYYKEQSNGVSC